MTLDLILSVLKLEATAGPLKDIQRLVVLKPLQPHLDCVLEVIIVLEG